MFPINKNTIGTFQTDIPDILNYRNLELLQHWLLYQLDNIQSGFLLIKFVLLR